MFEQYNPSEKNVIEENNLQLQNQVKKGATWFYWIAGASLVNTIIFLLGGNLNFVVGLGITQIINGIGVLVENQSGSPTAPKIGVFLVNLIISIFFLGIGYFSAKGMTWTFIVGVALYVLDGLIFFLFGDVFSIGFHAFALFFIIKGLLAANKLNKMPQPSNGQ